MPRMVTPGRFAAAVMAVGLLVGSCGGPTGDDGPGSCMWVTLWGDLSLVDALVEVTDISPTGRESTGDARPVSSGLVSRVLASDRSLAGVVGEGEVAEFVTSIDLTQTEGPVLLFLARPAEGSERTDLGVRIAAVEEGNGLRFLGDRAECWSDGFAEFVAEVDWSLVEHRAGSVVGSDDLRLMAAWAREITETKKPRRNGLITLAWFGDDDHHLYVPCRATPEDQQTQQSPFPMSLTPQSVQAGQKASLEIGVVGADGVAGWGGLWECWNGAEWVATHQMAHSRSTSRPGAALPIEPGTLTTMPAVGIRIPDTFTITIPDLPPGWYRLREQIGSDGESLVGYLAVRIVPG